MGRDKEVRMGSVIRSAGLLVPAFVLAVAGSAGATTIDVKVPFPFLVHGQMLPAGEYRVEQNPLDPSVMSIRGIKGNSEAVIVTTVPNAGHDPSGNAPALTFARDETQYRLADIWDSANEGWVVSYRASAGQTQTAASPSKAKTTTHATTGVVKSMNDTGLTITRSGKHAGDMTFDMNSSTQRDGNIQVGTPVSVRYKEEGSHHLAMAVAVQHPKHQTAAATTPSKK
jgi:hypothetical protein